MRSVPATVQRIWRPALLLAGLLASGLLLRQAPADLLALASARVASPAGALAYLLGGALLCAVGMPRQAVAYAGGYGFGLAGGVPLALAAQVLGCALDLFWARGVARTWTQRRIGTRLHQIDRSLAAEPFTVALLLRLLPVGNNLLLNLLAGVSSVAAGRFLAGSALGYLPQTLLFALAGMGTRVGHAAEAALGVALVLASAALGWLLLDRLRARTGPAALGADRLSEAGASANAAHERYGAIPTR